MGRKREALTVKLVESNKHEPGMYCDGKGLYLRVAAGGSKQWIYRYAVKDSTKKGGYRLHDMSLGPVDERSLAQARVKAQYYSSIRRRGIDPIAWKMLQRAKEEAEHTKIKTFQQCAEEYLQDNISRWGVGTLRSLKFGLRRYVYPKLGAMPVHLIETTHVLNDVLKPIWRRIPQSATAIRANIENILQWATVHHYRQGDNPAAWNLIKHVLPNPKDVRPIEHRPALPYQQMPQYMAALRQSTGISSRCIELIILTAVRADSAVGAKWGEFDRKAGVWTIPGARMKQKQRDKAKSFRVPLSTDAIALLDQMESIKRSEYVFPGGNFGSQTSAHIIRDVALSTAKHIAYLLSPEGVAEKAAQKQRGIGNLVGERALTSHERVARVRARRKLVNITLHGFRSTFKDWASEETSFPNEVSEMALAHAVSSAVEAAYRRKDLFEKRTKLMQAWADYCSGRSNDEKVIPIRPADSKVIPLIPAAAKASAQAGERTRGGRRPIGEVAMSGAERQRRRRVALKAQSAQGSDNSRGEPLSAVELVRRMRERRSAASKAQKLA